MQISYFYKISINFTCMHYFAQDQLKKVFFIVPIAFVVTNKLIQLKYSVSVFEQSKYKNNAFLHINCQALNICLNVYFY